MSYIYIHIHLYVCVCIYMEREIPKDCTKEYRYVQKDFGDFKMVLKMISDLTS